MKGEDIDGGNTESNSSISQNKSRTGSDSKFVDTGAEGSIQKVKGECVWYQVIEILNRNNDCPPFHM